MSTVLGAPTLLAAAAINHRDYVWARLPFVVPMAIAAARSRGDASAHELVHLVRLLRPLLLDHLGREEAMIVDRSAAPVTARIREGMHAEHLAVSSVIDQIRAAAGSDYHPRDGAAPIQRALYHELAQLDARVRSQIASEEHLMTWDRRPIGAGS